MRQSALLQAKNGAQPQSGQHVGTPDRDAAPWHRVAARVRALEGLPPLPRCLPPARLCLTRALACALAAAAFEILSRLPHHGMGSKLARTSWGDDCFWTVQKVRLSPVRAGRRGSRPQRWLCCLRQHLASEL